MTTRPARPARKAQSAQQGQPAPPAVEAAHAAASGGAPPIPRGANEATQLMSRDDAHVVAIHAVRAAAFRIAADCERMLEQLHAPERKAWCDAVGQALLASRELIAVASAAERSDVSAAAFVDRLSAQVRDPRARIVDATRSVLRFVPIGVEDELLLRDARTILRVASELAPFPGGRQSAGVAQPAGGDPTSSSGEAAKQSDTGSACVLIAEDEAALRSVLQRHMHRLGYDSVLAENGRLALELIEREPVDLVLTDINMPEIDGVALLRHLKSDERTRHIPVIVVSGEGDLPVVAHCIELGAEDHIMKPYEPQILRARVRASLERKRMRDVELDHLRRVAQLTAAAEAVANQTYVPGTLALLASGSDGVGQLARVFERMVSGIKTREERLHQRVRQLRHEMGEATRSTGAANRSSESPFASGEILAARYEIVGQLGKGGMGMVYHAHDLELREDVAVKVVRRDLVHADPTIVDRLKSEIRLARKISHPNVVRAHDLGEWKGTYFITMEFVRGITVAELLDRRGRLTVESTLAIGTQLAEALAVAHEQQIIHRDIKPSNLLVDEAGVLKVMDFGLARLIERDVNLTVGGFVIGTPHYMSPEQLMGGRVDARSDLFAVGVVLYECLAGRTPFAGESPIGLLSAMVEGNVLPMDAADVPVELTRIIGKLMESQPENRIATARDLAGMLGELESLELRA